MSGSSVANADSWRNLEQSFLEVIILALEMLHAKPSLPLVEATEKRGCDSLNRQLGKSLYHAIAKWETLTGHPLPATLMPNTQQLADLEDEDTVNEFESKRPDFQLSLHDRLSSSDSLNYYFRCYCVECKRLGAKISSGELAELYVTEGVHRFIHKAHSYGQHTISGAMIGYVQNMDLKPLLDKVNHAATSAVLPELVLDSNGWQPTVSRLDHQLDRTEVQPTPFDLRHLWIDLRQHYMNNSGGCAQSEQVDAVPSKQPRQSKPRSSRRKAPKAAQQE